MVYPGNTASAATPVGPFDQAGPRYVQELAEQVSQHLQRMELLVRDLRSSRRPLPFRRTLSTQTDASGNADVQLYVTPAGMIGSVHRIVVEAQGFTPITAAVASGWIGFYRGPNAPLGGLVDFAPANGANAGLVLPAVATDAANEGSYLRNNEELWLHLVGTATLASKQLVVTVQGMEFQQGGVHMESD